MAKLKVNKAGGGAAAADAAPSVEVVTPSEQITHAAAASVTVTSEEGRVITVAKVGPLKRMRLFEIIGPDAARNERYVGMAALAIAVTHIDGERVPPPNTKREVEALVDRLGDDGLNAAGEGMAKLFGVERDADGNIIDAEGKVLVAAKN